MKDTIWRYRKYLERTKGRKKQIEEEIQKQKIKIKKLTHDLENSKKAQSVIQIVAKSTQENLSYKLSDIGSMAMASVFPNPYRLLIEFKPSGGKIDVDLGFVKDGNKIDPIIGTGGGAIDIAALSLRFSCWAIHKHKTRPIMVMDEPLKWLKGGDLPEKGAAIIKELSKKLNIQIIMVSHDPELINSADRVIKVSIKKGISKINYS